MCVVASTDPPTELLRRAAAGELPVWAVASAARREHIARVAALMDEWAARLGLSEVDRVRWRAAGWLHDSLRDADPEALHAELGTEFSDFPAPLLHGPAAAARLGDAVDAEVADAIRYHTLGHPRLGRLGRTLYLADFLEPGRAFAPEWRGGLRARMPQEMPAVLIEVVAARIGHLLEHRTPIRPETAAFWNMLVHEAR